MGQGGVFANTSATYSSKLILIHFLIPSGGCVSRVLSVLGQTGGFRAVFLELPVDR
jgi:hypothetical protein